jgi:filamentous hemagglutinin family protein
MNHQEGLGRFRPKLICIAVASCFAAGTALANPSGHTVRHGNVTVKEVGNLLKIHNSPNAVIDWRSFSIGASEITRFVQQSRNSVVMNRVVGSGGTIDTSVILGTLKSNGRVYLLNSSGVVFGAGSVVDVAGLVVSSLQLSDADFHAKRLRFTHGAGAGKIENHGNITTKSGGEVYLVGPAVANSGVITSPNGDVVLAAGNQVELVNPGTPNLRVEITAPDNQAVNLGNIVAESGRIGIYAGLINNSGTIRADSAVAEGGRILLKAKQSVTLESSSLLDASGVGGGTIEMLAKDGGTVNVAGRLDASAPTGGNGGFIETSATDVNVATGTVVTTKAPHGKTGMWLVDPNNYRVASYGGDITGAQLSSNLNSTNVTLSSDMGATAGSGDMIVDDSVSWGSGNSLTLLARNNVNVNQSIINEGNGAIRMYAGWNGSSPNNPAVVNGAGSISLNSSVQTAGDMSLIAGNQVWQNSNGVVAANGLLVKAGPGGIHLSNAVNDVSRIAGSAGNNFYFQNGRTLTVGTVEDASGNAVSGIKVNGDFAQVNLYVSGNQAAHLQVNQDITANGAAYGGQIYLNASGGYGGEINVRNAALRATGSSDVESSSYIDLYGSTIRIENSTLSSAGRYAGIYIYGFGPDGVEIRNSNVEALASGGDAFVSIGTGFSGGNALIDASTVTATGRNASLTAYGGDVTVKSSTLAATGQTAENGGSGVVSIGTGFSGGNALIDASTVTAKGVNASLSAYGGDVTVKNSTLTAAGQTAENGGSGVVSIGNGFSGGNVLVDSSKVRATGGGAGAVLSAYGGNVTVSNSAITATGDANLETGSSVIVISAGNAIDTGTSSLTASANNSQPSQNTENGFIILAAGEGDIKLGSLSSNGFILVSSAAGKIVDGNSGTNNVVAPFAYLFGAGGVGSTSNPLETQVGSILVAANSGQIGIINSGNLRLEALTSGGSDTVIRTTGEFTFGTPVSVSGNLALTGNNGMVVDQGISAVGDLSLSGGAGDLGISGVSVSGQNVELVGNNIFVGSTTASAPTSVTASHLVKATTTGNFEVIGGAHSSAYSIVSGEDVDLTVGGELRLSAGGARAQVDSSLPVTITVSFPNRAAGGYFVNDVEGAIYDEATNSGFLAGGQPAVLGQGLKVTYGGVGIPDEVKQVGDLNTDAMNNSGDLLGQNNNVTLAPDEKQDGKASPVCN